MFHINKLSVLGVTILISLLVITTVPSFAVDTNNTNASNTGPNAQPRGNFCIKLLIIHISTFTLSTDISLEK